jgi:hypothetical protein
MYVYLDLAQRFLNAYRVYYWLAAEQTKTCMLGLIFRTL